MALILWLLLPVSAIAFIFAFGPVVLLLESIFDTNTRADFFTYGGWKECGALSLIAWVILAACIYGMISIG